MFGAGLQHGRAVPLPPSPCRVPGRKRPCRRWLSTPDDGSQSHHCPRCSRRGPSAPSWDGPAGAAGLDVRVVQVEGEPVRADPRDLGEVVPRRRARDRPLQRVRIPPRVIGRDPLAVLQRYNAQHHTPAGGRCNHRQGGGATISRSSWGPALQRRVRGRRGTPGRCTRCPCSPAFLVCPGRAGSPPIRSGRPAFGLHYAHIQSADCRAPGGHRGAGGGDR
jgi:hypothetical protein